MLQNFEKRIENHHLYKTSLNLKCLMNKHYTTAWRKSGSNWLNQDYTRVRTLDMNDGIGHCEHVADFHCITCLLQKNMMTMMS